MKLEAQLLANGRLEEWLQRLKLIQRLTKSNQQVQSAWVD